jgi:iron complex transport system ATP-binding protein
MPLLNVRHLSAGYNDTNVIEDISFSLQPGEFVSILGRNGSGKSTLIKALQGMLKKSAGSVEVESENVFSLSARKLAKRIAYVPQISSLVFPFSVEEIIQMGRYIHQQRLSGPSPDDQKTAREVMELTGISHLRKKKIANLSGGEQQRVFIARALAQNTPLLLLDEPSSHLDISYQIEIYRILKRLQQEKGKTILSTEHNINLAIPYSQRLILLKKGKIYAQGSPEELITKSHIRNVFGAEVDIRVNPHSKLPEIALIPYIQGTF